MQLDLFNQPPLPQPAEKPPQQRKGFSTADIRYIRQHYTNGSMSGKAAAHHLGRTYSSFKQFVFRNPELMKRDKEKRVPANYAETLLIMPPEAAND